jgi:hypothetical protein
MSINPSRFELARQRYAKSNAKFDKQMIKLGAPTMAQMATEHEVHKQKKEAAKTFGELTEQEQAEFIENFDKHQIELGQPTWAELQADNSEMEPNIEHMSSKEFDVWLKQENRKLRREGFIAVITSIWFWFTVCGITGAIAADLLYWRR